MSGNGPKSKDTNEKIKFFRIDEEGEIRPASEQNKDGTNAEEDAGTFLPLEPVFTTPSESKTPDVALEMEELKKEPSEAFLEEQLHLLQPQVDDISRIPDKQGLSTDQIDVLRKYLSLKEAEVRDLRDQHRQYQAFLKKVSRGLEAHTRKNRELLSELESVKRRDEHQRTELRELKDRHHDEIARLKNDFEERLRQSGNYEEAAEDLVKKREEWREKLREDLKRIKLKERELETKYELLKRDTQALLDSKDKHLLELKKKNDALELELETLEDRLRKNSSVMGSIESKKRRLIETMKLAIGLLEEIDSADTKPEPVGRERKTG